MKAGAHSSIDQPGGAPLFAVGARWLLGGVFIYLGLAKAMHPVDFLKLLREYDILPARVALNLAAALIPWLELFCGLLLLLGLAVRGAAMVLLVMLGAFTTAVLVRALAIRGISGLPFCAVKFDCGCGAGEILICRKLCENAALMSLCAVLLWVRNHRLCLRPIVF